MTAFEANWTATLSSTTLMYQTILHRLHVSQHWWLAREIFVNQGLGTVVQNETEVKETPSHHEHGSCG